MRFHSYIVSLLILVSFPGIGFVTAQTFELKGHLVDSGSGEPLVGAHVFLNKTTIGTVTDEHGAYTLEGIPEGLQLIVFSRVGYKDRAIRIEFPLYQEDYSNLGLEAEPEGFQLVSGSRKWKRNLRAFKEHLLGTTPNSDEVEILNPEVLNFESYNRSLVATANAPLDIVNNALGYKITYFLKESISNDEMFSASFYAKFEEMPPSSTEEEEKWNTGRAEAYEGSFVHFINSLSQDSPGETDFSVFGSSASQINVFNKYDPHSIKIESTADFYSELEYEDDWIELFLPDNYETIKVMFSRENTGGRDNILQMSWIEIPDGNVIVNKYTGSYSPSNYYILHGHWGWAHRIPDMLPENYTRF